MSGHAIAMALVGGALIGLAAGGMLLLNGRIAGISGILTGLLRPAAGAVGWRAAFVAGLLAGGVVLRFAYPAAFPARIDSSLPVLVAAGLLVGVGARVGNGCTSGHGVCGVGRLSERSLVATLVFMMAGAVTVAIARHGLGG